MRLVRYHTAGTSINRGKPEAGPRGTAQFCSRERPVPASSANAHRCDRVLVYQGWRDFQSSIAFRMASGARLLHFILYSGMPPNARATACSEI